MAELAYALPAPDRSFSAAIHGLKQFSIDLNKGGTDSGGRNFKWAIKAPPAPPPGPRGARRPSRPHATAPAPPPSATPAARPRSASSNGRLQSSCGPVASIRFQSDPARIYGRLPSLEVEPPLLKPFTDDRGLSCAIPRAYQQYIDLTPVAPPLQAPFQFYDGGDVIKPRPLSDFLPPRPAMGGMVSLPKLPAPAIHPPASSIHPPVACEEFVRTSVRAPPPLPKPSSLEEYVFKASNELLCTPGSANLVWCTVDGEADYRRLRPGEFYNHFQNNHELTTKVGLADNLLHHAVASGTCVDTFFPRSYDVGRGRGEREDFLLDFRRSAALKVVLQHLRLEKAGRSYESNLDVMRIAKQTLQHWCHDLDATHIDEEEDQQRPRVGEEGWDALVLYSELSEGHLLRAEGQDSSLMQHPRKRFTRIGGGDLDDDRPRDHTGNEATASRSADVLSWHEFHGHRWGSASEDSRLVLEQLTAQLEKLNPQWALQGGWNSRNVWIVKPGTNSKGSGVECMNTLPELLHHCDTMPNRLIQKYIERPLLLFSGRKFDIRQWVLVRSVSPLRVFLFSECYLRLCNEMYDPGDLKNRERHISNWQVNKHGKNVVDGAVASLSEFKDELREITDCSSFWEDKLLPQVQDIVVQTLRAVEGKLQPRQDSFELYGFDLMVDEQMHMWLLEVNLSPGCDGRTPFLDQMLARMSKRLVEVAVLGQEAPDGEQPDWVNICDDAADSKTARMLDAAQRAPRNLPCTDDLTLQGQQMRLPRRGQRPVASAPTEAKAPQDEMSNTSPSLASETPRHVPHSGEGQHMCSDSRLNSTTCKPALQDSTPLMSNDSEAEERCPDPHSSRRTSPVREIAACSNLALDSATPYISTGSEVEDGHAAKNPSGRSSPVLETSRLPVCEAQERCPELQASRSGSPLPAAEPEELSSATYASDDYCASSGSAEIASEALAMRPCKDNCATAEREALNSGTTSTAQEDEEEEAYSEVEDDWASESDRSSEDETEP